MSKLCQSPVPLTQTTFTTFKQKMNKYLKANAKKSLFQKLQYYDQIIGQLKISRTEEKVLRVFKELIEQCGRDQYMSRDKDIDEERYLQKNKKYSAHVFSSPTNNKKQSSIQDPELFSFSKTRKQSHNKSNSQNGEKPTIIHKHGLQRFNKVKQNSDKPRYTAPIMTETNQRRVSEFNGEFVEENYTENGDPELNKDQGKSIYQLGKLLKQKVVGKNLSIFLQLLRLNIKQRKRNFKQKTSQYIHEIKLMKKTILSFKNYHNEMTGKVRQFRNRKQQEKLQQVFYGWHQYSTRPQQQRIREKQIKVKKLLLTQLLGIRQFIRNSYIPSYVQPLDEEWDNRVFSYTYKNQLIEQNKMKSDLLIKSMAVNSLRHRHQSKLQLQQKQKQLITVQKTKCVGVLFKLMRCYIQTQRLRYEKLGERVTRKINAMRLIKELKQQYIFQRAYWSDHQTQSPLKRLDVSGLDVCDYQDKEQHQFLNKKYRKIVLLYELFDCAHHSLSRKGYKFLSKSQQSPSFTSQLQSHPAYQTYYRPKKLHQYFTAMKNILLVEKEQKIHQIKYKINGNRVIRDGLLTWYKRHLQKQLIFETIAQKQADLEHYLADKRNKQFLSLFQKDAKYQSRKVMVEKGLRVSRVVDTVMVLKTYMVSKDYYRKVILQCKLKKKLRILESYFLQWKLYYSENVHSRLLDKDLTQIRQKYALKTIKENINLYSLQDRLHNKKCQNIQKSLLANHGQRFLVLLRRQWQQKKKSLKASKSQFEDNSKALAELVETGRKQKFLNELTEFWYHCRLAKQIQRKIQMQYERKILAKCMIGLKVMVRVEKEQQRRVNIIRKKKQKTVKTQVLSAFIQKMIQKLMLKRLGSMAKKYWFHQFTLKASAYSEEESSAQNISQEDINE